LADFVSDAPKTYDFDLQHVIAVGCSNDANIAARKDSSQDKNSWHKPNLLEDPRRLHATDDITPISANHGNEFLWCYQTSWEGVSSDFKHDDEVYGQAGVTNGGSGGFAELALANAKNIADKAQVYKSMGAAALPLVCVSV
jgi:hypothetical protein